MRQAGRGYNEEEEASWPFPPNVGDAKGQRCRLLHPLTLFWEEGSNL